MQPLHGLAKSGRDHDATVGEPHGGGAEQPAARWRDQFHGSPGAHCGDESRKAAAGAIQTAAAKIQRTGLRSRPPPARLVPDHAGAVGATTAEIDRPALMIHEA